MEGTKEQVLVLRPGATAHVTLQPSKATKHEQPSVVADGARRWAAPESAAPLTCAVLDISSVLTDGVAMMVDDSFTRCFTSNPPKKEHRRSADVLQRATYRLDWAFRHVVRFPLSLALFVAGMVSICAVCVLVDLLVPACRRKLAAQRKLVQWMCCIFLLPLHVVVRYRGPKPTPGRNRVWVANHTSMLDYPVLGCLAPTAAIQQWHHSWVAFIQNRVLRPIGCICMDRADIRDRAMAAARMKEHVSNPDATPLLIFPEGTCVNTKYSVLFKRGAFDIGATVFPVAIKYDDTFVDAFLNSGTESFNRYLFRLMTSWALSVEVHYLEPQTKRSGETSHEFASRVQAMIAEAAGLRVVPWDGSLRKVKLAEAKPHLVEGRQRDFADAVRAALTAAMPAVVEAAVVST